MMSFVRSFFNRVLLNSHILEFIQGNKIIRNYIHNIKLKLIKIRDSYEEKIAARKRLLKINAILADPHDAGFFRFDFDKFKYLPAGETQLIANEWNELYQNGNYEQIVNKIISTINIKVVFNLDQQYFHNYATYYLACFFAELGDAEKVFFYADKIKFYAPPDGTNFLPYEIKHTTRLNFCRQIMAIKREAPSVLVIALPKSASAFLAHSLSTILDVPILRFTVGEQFTSYPVLKWVKQITRGGACIHEHMEATNENIKVLQTANVENIWIQIRDPRDAVFSSLKSIHYNDNGSEQAELFINNCVYYANWIAKWIDASKSNDKINIRFITYKQVTKDFDNTIKVLLNKKMNKSIEQRISQYSAALNKIKIPNYRKGIDGDWRSAFTAEIGDKVWLQIPETVKEILDLKP